MVIQAHEQTKWQVVAARSSIEFDARHLPFNVVHGRFERFSASIHVDEKDMTRSSIRATIYVGSLDTGNPERDLHLRELFPADRFPIATFESRHVRVVGPQLEVTGDLALHGVTHEVTLVVEPETHDRTIVFRAKTAISRKDFALQWNAAIEWTSGVSDRVEISLRLEAKRH